MIVLDAHVHLWDLARRPQPWIDPETMAVLHRSFSDAELVDTCAAADVSGVVLVQVLNDRDETQEMLATAATHPLVRGVVGWTDLADSAVADNLHACPAHLVGIRHQALAEDDPVAWFRQPSVGRGLQQLAEADLAFDVMLRWQHLPHVQPLFDSATELRVVLDHAGKAPVHEGAQGPDFPGWAAAIRQIAARDRTWCKLSGLTTMALPGPWDAATLAPFVDVLLEAFGPQRLIFGSDWPVSLRAGAYPELIQTVLTLLEQLTASEQEAILRSNAVEAYRLIE